MDAQGRVVVLHGFNIMKKAKPFYPAQFTPQDGQFLSSYGFTAARIGFIWAGVEPQPGKYDDAYIRHVLDFAGLLERFGIHPLVDFHQDSYGTTDPNCAATGYCTIASGDGAPSWAQLSSSTDGDFQAFWDNKPASDHVGIQTHFIDAWRHVIHMLDASPIGAGVLGLDPFNEPYPGSGYPSPCGDFAACPKFEKTQLYAFYNRFIHAMRGAGDRHIIFPEGIAQNAKAMPSLPRFKDQDTAFNWHYYCTASQLVPDETGVLTAKACAAPDAAAFANIVKYTQPLGVPWMVSEFGSSDADPEYANEVDWMDSHFLSWTEWAYYQGATDPGDTPAQGLLTDDSMPGSASNSDPNKLLALGVPYAEQIAGTPVSYNFDRSSTTMTLTYLARAVPGTRLAPDALTNLFVPTDQYPHGYQLILTNAHVATTYGQWVELAADHQGRPVTVKVTP